jgi:hypothetical protein
MSADDIQKLLNEDVPREHITERKSGSTSLSYVTGRYVKQRLSEIFGWDGWTYTVVEQKIITLDANCIRWFAHVALSVHTEDGCIERHGIAVGHGLLSKEVWENKQRTGRYEPVSAGRANEVIDFAAAEAVTDALKRAAVSIGQNLGLSLYPYAKGDTSKLPTAEESQELEARFLGQISESTNLASLKQVGGRIKADQEKLSGDAIRSLKALYSGKQHELEMEVMGDD